MRILKLSIILLFVAVSHTNAQTSDNEGNGMIMSTQAYRLIRNGKHKEALPLLQKGEKVYSNKYDTLNKEFVKAFLLPQFECFRVMKRYEEATAIAHRIDVIYQKENIRREVQPDHTEKFSETALKSEQERKNEKEKLYSSSSVNYMLAIAGALLVIYGVIATAFLIHNMLQNRRKDKARMLVIERMQRYKRLLYGISMGKLSDPVHGKKALEELLAQPDVSEDERTFWKLMSAIIEKKMYLTPNLTREDVTKEVYVPKNKFANLFKEHANTTFKAYINSLRIDEAIEIMKKHPEYTIEAIASECGMQSVQTFYRVFSENTGMSPAEYRSNLKDKDSKLPTPAQVNEEE